MFANGNVVLNRLRKAIAATTPANSEWTRESSMRLRHGPHAVRLQAENL
jgi:hypothetical protein